MRIVAGVVVLVVLVVVFLWLVNLPGDDDEPEETLGFIAANWPRFRR
jgi:hypothetical protein